MTEVAEVADTITFDVDYNDRDKDGRLLASMRYASGAPRFPRPGERVVTADDDGNACEGTVFSVEGLIVTITLDRETWTRNVARIANPYKTVVVAEPGEQETLPATETTSDTKVPQFA